MNRAIISWASQQLVREHVHGKCVLEVGSLELHGYMRSLVLPLLPAKYVGVDARPGPNVDRVGQADTVHEMFGPRSQDLVITTEMLEHVRDWRSTVTALKLVLRPGGHLMLTTRSPGYPRHLEPEDHWRFRPERLAEIFGDLDIVDLRADPQEPGAFVYAAKPVRPRRTVNLDELEAEAAPKE